MRNLLEPKSFWNVDAAILPEETYVLHQSSRSRQEPGTVVYICNPSIQEAKAGELFFVAHKDRAPWSTQHIRGDPQFMAWLYSVSLANNLLICPINLLIYKVWMQEVFSFTDLRMRKTRQRSGERKGERGQNNRLNKFIVYKKGRLIPFLTRQLPSFASLPWHFLSMYPVPDPEAENTFPDLKLTV